MTNFLSGITLSVSKTVDEGNDGVLIIRVSEVKRDVSNVRGRWHERITCANNGSLEESVDRGEIISLVGSVWSHFMYVTFNIVEDRSDNWFDVWDFEESN